MNGQPDRMAVRSLSDVKAMEKPVMKVVTLKNIPNVPAEGIAGPLAEPASALRRGEIQLLQQITQPGGAVLDDRETQSRVAIEHLVTDRGGHRLGRCPVLRDDAL